VGSGYGYAYATLNQTYKMTTSRPIPNMMEGEIVPILYHVIKNVDQFQVDREKVAWQASVGRSQSSYQRY